MNTKKDDKTLYYDEIISKMEKHLQVFVHESCQAVYTYLKIYGKMTSTNLMEMLDFSRGTIFKSLLLLQEAGFIKKGIDPSIKDKRKSAFYYAIDAEIEVTSDEGFYKHIVKTKKLNTYKAWLQESSTLEIGMIKISYQLALKSHLEKFQQGIFSSTTPTNNKEVTYIIRYTDINSVENRSRLIEKINQCIKEFEEQNEKEQDYQEPLKNPVTFAIFFIPI